MFLGSKYLEKHLLCSTSASCFLIDDIGSQKQHSHVKTQHAHSELL